MKKNRGLKLGVIGLGTMGKHHARIASTLPGVKLVGVVDVNEETSRTIGQQYKAPFYTNFQQLLPEADAIVLASPTATHFEIGLEILKAGKPLLIEKPLAKTAAEAKQLVDVAKENNTILTVGLIERFNPAFVELKKILKKEKKIIGIDIKRFSPFPARISDANVIQDMMIHDLDLLPALLPKEEVEDLKASGKKIKTKVLDQVETTIYFKSGIIAKVSADRVFSDKTRKITATTDKAIYEADLLNKQVYVRTLDSPVPSTHHTKESDQLTEELKNFILAVKGKKDLVVSAEDGYNCIKLAEEVEQACS